jgi:hypothetical protein
VDGGNESARARLLGIGQHLARIADLDELPLVHEGDPVADLAGEAELVVTTIIVMPVPARSRITPSTSPTSSGSSAEVGSSKRSSSGRMARARAMATRCC